MVLSALIGCFAGGVKERFKKVSPAGPLHLDFLANFIPNPELLLHNLQCACRNMCGRVPVWIRRGNDGHNVTPVIMILAWIPHGKTKLPILVNGAKHHRVRPVPLGEDAKESGDQRARHSIRIGLADSCNQQSTVDFPEKASSLARHSIRANTSSFRPVLHTP